MSDQSEITDEMRAEAKWNPALPTFEKVTKPVAIKGPYGIAYGIPFFADFVMEGFAEGKWHRILHDSKTRMMQVQR